MFVIDDSLWMTKEARLITHRYGEQRIVLPFPDQLPGEIVEDEIKNSMTPS